MRKAGVVDMAVMAADAAAAAGVVIGVVVDNDANIADDDDVFVGAIVVGAVAVVSVVMVVFATVCVLAIELVGGIHIVLARDLAQDMGLCLVMCLAVLLGWLLAVANSVGIICARFLLFWMLHFLDGAVVVVAAVDADADVVDVVVHVEHDESGDGLRHLCRGRHCGL